MAHGVIPKIERDAYRNAAARFLRQARKQLGLTQVEAARIAGIPQSALSRIETGKINPPAWWIMYLMHISPGLLGNADQGADHLRAVARGRVEGMSVSGLRRVLSMPDE